jgi:phospholipid/cholesterol/gamma-HCH transport system substrate-binding protein
MDDNAPTPSNPPGAPPPVAHLELKATLLLLLLIALFAASAAYLMYARGAFEATQELVLVSDDSEGVVVGMDLTFSGFPIGRVRRVELAPDGNARILIDVPRKDAHWLRESSVFTLVRGLVGNTNLRAFSGILTDPPLPDGAVRTVLKGDATAEIPRLVAAARDLVQNLTALTAADGALASSLGNVQSLTGQLNDRFKGPGGAIGALTGNEADARKVAQLLDRTNTLLARLDGLTAKADTQVFGQEGLVRDLKTTVQQINTLLGDARGTLQKVDGVLQEAQAVGANVRTATTDLGPLRAEVEASLRKVDHLLNEVNRKWPFARDTEIKLP